MASKRKRRRRVGGSPSHAASPPESLRPVAAPSTPAERIHWVVSRNAAGVRVNEDTALTVPAVWAAVRLISESLAVLPWHTFRRRADGGRDPAPKHAADEVIHIQANGETSAFHWRETSVAHALLWGNGYSEIEPTPLGQVAALWQITPDRVRPVRSQRTGVLEYEVQNYIQSPRMLKANRVFHLKGLGFDGLQGYSVVSMAARSLGMAIAQETYGAAFFANDATPGGILKTPTKLETTARDRLQETWFGAHGGPYKARRLAVLEGGLEWVATGMPNEDAQFLQSRQFGITDVARWFRVPPHKIADLLRATFSNIEQQELDFVTDSLLPWIRRLESEADMKLIDERDRGKIFTKLNVMGRLRGDSGSRTAYYVPLMDRGILTVNEVRQIEDMNPIGPDGDKRFVAMNMQLLEDAGEEEDEPAQEPEPDDSSQEGGETVDQDGNGTQAVEGGEQEDLRAILHASLSGPWERLRGREDSRRRDLIRRGKGNGQLLNSLARDQGRYLTECLAPALEVACALLSSVDRAPQLLASAREQYLDDLRAAHTGDPVSRWDGPAWIIETLMGCEHADTSA